MLYINGSQVHTSHFPDKTSQVWQLSKFILNETNHAHITWDFEKESEFLELAQLKDLLDRYQFTAHLTINYLPYARQDKLISNDTTFALHTFSRLLNSLRFNKIQILDPHSDVAIQLIDNSEAFYSIETLLTVKNLTKSDLFCYPDKGARSKYTYVYEYPSIYGEKVRDQITGFITSYEVFGEIKDKNILIVDDICDGGATFTILTKQLLEKGAKEVNLFTTHGLYTKGIKVLKQSGIKRIFFNKGEVFEDSQGFSYKPII